MNEQLIRDSKQFFANMEAFTRILSEEPAKDNIKQHNGFDYLPIGYIEPDLRNTFFGMVKFNILNSRTVGNETEVTASIEVFHPVALEWWCFHGIGMDVDPANAYAEAKKTAAKQIGPRYGSNLNRKEWGDYKPSEQPKDGEAIKSKQHDEVPAAIKRAISAAKSVGALQSLADRNEKLAKNANFNKLLLTKKAELLKAKKDGN